jgi:ABC-type transport system involved in multi-copper enzyme maturation permease subunit
VRYSPVESFRLFTEKVFAVEWVSETGQTLKLPLELYLMRNLDLIAIQIVSVVAVFILCYVLFVRKDEM